MLRNLFSSILIFVATSLISCSPNDPEEDIKAVDAHSAYDFVNSIGVNTHFGFYETNYWDKWDEITFPRLKELGVKHIRDGYGYRVPVGQDRFIQAGQTGIKLLLSAATDTPDQLKPKIDALLPYLSGVEAVNEVDLSIDSNQNPEVWVPYAKTKQQELYNLIKNTPAYSNLPVISLSLGNIRDNADLLGNISEWVDYGNIHAYAAGRHPALHWGYDLTADQIFKRARVLFGDKIIMATEAGYHNYEQLGLSHPGVPEDVSAIYLPQLFFEYFNKGIDRTYIYEFLDQNKRSDWADAPEMEWHFGLIRTDGSAKPAFYALKNLISLLSDDNETFIPSSLKFEVNADETNVNNNLRNTLLQKSDGSWWIALYRAEDVYNPTFLARKTLQSAIVHLKLGVVAKTIEIYMPNKSTDKQLSYVDKNSIDINLGEELVLVQVKM